MRQKRTPKTLPEQSKISRESSHKRKRKLTGEQRQIIQSTESVKQIVAVAGAAKTTTCIACAERLIGQGVKPAEIVFLTALNSARDVLEAKLRPNLPDIKCLTFHALGLRLALETGLISASRASEPLSDNGRLKLLTKGLRQEAKRRATSHPRSSKFLRTMAANPSNVRHVLTFLDQVKVRGSKWAKTASKAGSTYIGFGLHLKALRSVARRFSRIKGQAGAFDFPDMLKLGRKAVESGVEFGFKHVFVDESQDCNQSQVQMLVAMACRLKSLTVVGDPLQAILGFTGAGFTDLATFIPGTKTYPLTVSFRLDGGRAALATALGRLVRPGMPALVGYRSGTHRPILVRCGDRAEHDRAVLDRVKQLIAAGNSPHQIAIIGRVKLQLREAEALLLSEGIETNPLGRSRAPEHVQAVLTLTEAVQGCVGKPGREKLRLAITDLAGTRRMPDSTREDNVRMLLNAGQSSAFESRYRACAKAYISAKGKRGLSKDAIADINRWAPLTRQVQDAVGMRKVIVNFAAQNKVVTSHVHQAKGHEWDYVLVLHAVEGSWPFFKATTKAALDEELHSLYVAVTRAKKGVVLFEGRYQNARARKVFSEPSSFLAHQQVRAMLKVIAA